MSMFENSQYRWRETYFVLFESGNRPTLTAVEQALSELNENYEVTNLSADEQGRFDSLTLLSPEDFAALDICFTSGIEVLEQGAALAEEVGPAACQPGEKDPAERDATRQLKQCDARFDVLHFEQIPAMPEDGEDDEILDPSALLLVLTALARITGGIAVDPQAGAVLDDEQ